MSGRFGGILLIFLLLTSCHVLERAGQCKELVQLVEEAAPEIQNTSIKDNPDAQSLRKKARLYGQLGDKVGSVSFEDASLQKEHKAFVNSLQSLEVHLSEAADAVDKEAKYQEEQERAAAAPPSGDSQTSTRIPTLTRSSLHARRYAQAKRAAENAGRSMTSSAERLTKGCF
jgi:hypothetical protein